MFQGMGIPGGGGEVGRFRRGEDTRHYTMARSRCITFGLCKAKTMGKKNQLTSKNEQLTIVHQPTPKKCG